LYLALADGFLNEGWRDGIAITGVVLTLIGFSLALLAAVAAMRSAKTAQKAAHQATSALLKNLDIADASSAIRLIEEVAGQIHGKQYEMARMRLDELRLLIVQIAEAPGRDPDLSDDFRQYIALVASCEDILVSYHAGQGKIDEVDLNRTLRSVSNFLKSFETRSRLESGAQNADA